MRSVSTLPLYRNDFFFLVPCPSEPRPPARRIQMAIPTPQFFPFSRREAQNLLGWLLSNSFLPQRNGPIEPLKPHPIWIVNHISCLSPHTFFCKCSNHRVCHPATDLPFLKGQSCCCHPA
ncbi:uncharacterized protein CCOS01_03197 [Colletotrichum costaricense]|uniref:Uncharacterized protein n=2 Tax=Colletotrichum acutatum species complex TaxID=2707335 RepID=A0AAI9Z4P1_9PEZI|nr:uncharacterized protein CCOS01_03197 [Colletotrichum costaricense]XP_060386791.1 uncharacterized protein CTAM01_02119 [Colletotrichum tamarilloi]KAK1508333.1 hypothetical protein CTAM01_02119 [Colletotrichum tamarilloi]KAK1534445.1 hypothetical protein CCOS01_03197 [Colletotrichum costaricense]